MTEWKIYTGSDEQIAEIDNCETDVLFEFHSGGIRFKSHMFIDDWKLGLIIQYCICKRHPLADMIIRQAETGQEVYIRCGYIKTTTPEWNIPNAEYSFTPFEEEV